MAMIDTTINDYFERAFDKSIKDQLVAMAKKRILISIDEQVNSMAIELARSLVASVQRMPFPIDSDARITVIIDKQKIEFTE